MNAKIKNTIIGAAMGLFAMGANAATFENCQVVEDVTNVLVVRKVTHKSVEEFMLAVERLAIKYDLTDYDRKVLFGMAAMLVVREQSRNLFTAPDDFRKVCEKEGPDKAAGIFHKIWVDVSRK